MEESPNVTESHPVSGNVMGLLGKAPSLVRVQSMVLGKKGWLGFPPPSQPTPPQPMLLQHAPHAPGAKPKITSYFKVETPEETTMCREHEARLYSEVSEQECLQEVEGKRKKKARDRVNANEHMQ
ncbi:hypothetical protein B0H10DRAFT_1947033 [Mycena sp. CBHHK59/15]|nr:hypothetical protein B0H10DRAFT_1947033 [Mycena sp. CBHHK59/15]